MISLEYARELVRMALEGSDVSPDNASSVADALVAAEADGQSGHGLSRVAHYAAQAKCGKVKGRAVPRLERRAAALLAVDAGNGFAFPAIDTAIESLCSISPQTGVAASLISRSHHCGQLGYHVERLAERGFVSLMVSNAPAAMAPWGGSKAVFGTNPIAFAAPRRQGLPLVIDLSLSHVARGKVMVAARANQPIPEGWAVDSEGRPTTDPKEALEGTMLPAGGQKGAVLALIVEILSATLSGANHSFEASSFFDTLGTAPGVGHTIIAFDPAMAGGNFLERLEVLLDAISSQEGTRLPGAKREAARERAQREGISVPAHVIEEIRQLAGRE